MHGSEQRVLNWTLGVLELSCAVVDLYQSFCNFKRCVFSNLCHRLTDDSSSDTTGCTHTIKKPLKIKLRVAHILSFTKPELPLKFF